MSYVDQEHDQLDPEKSVYEVISEGNEIIDLGGKEMNARAYVSKFNFSGQDQGKKRLVVILQLVSSIAQGL